MFAFHPDIVFSPFAWPKHILLRKIDELLEYIEPRATKKQATLVKTLHEMKNRPSFEEEYIAENIVQRKSDGKGFQDWLDEIRDEKITMADIYKADDELYDWWVSND
jgi:hypothetical protein